MIVKSKLSGQLRRPKNAAQRKALASRDFLRRQQLSEAGVTPEPVNYVAILDGAMQSWIFSEEIPLIDGDQITFSILANNAPQSGIAIIFSYLGNYRKLLRVDDGVFITGFGEVTENGQVVTELATDGKVHTYTLSLTSSTPGIYYVGAHYDGANLIRHLSNAVFDIVITRPSVGVILDLPLTNKDQGAKQLATVGNINAFMPNYTDAVWRKP